MIRHIGAILGDKHATDRAKWLVNNSDELYNYSQSNCAGSDLKVTREVPDSGGGNVINIETYLN